MKILLVEDTLALAQNVQDFLELEKFSVDHIADGAQVRKQVERVLYDVILLDVMLPGVDGMTLCREIRKHQNTPIIMMTAKGQIEDKQEAYAGGADDYLVKPFALEELVMRIRALLKRSQPLELYRREDLEIDLEANEVRKGGEEVHMPLKELQLIQCLIDLAGRPVSRTDLIEYIRGSDAVRDHDQHLDVYIANLRKKLGKEWIET